MKKYLSDKEVSLLTDNELIKEHFRKEQEEIDEINQMIAFCRRAIKKPALKLATMYGVRV